ncbi:MAG: Rpn family recombination-promoting nuclease/putative transposase [Leptolyngbyaceae cyanobacterium SL_5_9]|nr:Rpn family recombination-promoting nuclease/putative transposase [Leptolyngbyaceae cyanobacterium SL_5_9]
MAFDNLCKLLSEQYPDRFAAWLLGEVPDSIRVLKTELSIEPIRADYVTFLETQERILHLEFQTKLPAEPPLPLRMLDYWVRLYRRYRLPITQVLVLLRPPSSGTVIETRFQVETTRHDYRVVRMWEQDPEIFLRDPALLPLATLAATNQPEQLMSRIAEEVSKIELSERRQEIATCTQVLAGLRFDKEFIRSFFRGESMRESVIYQEILKEGLQEGRQRGLQQGLQEGLQQGLQEGLQQGLQEGLQQGLQQGELSLVLRQLSRRVGEIPVELKAQIQALSLSQLEELGEALLDFSSLEDLMVWLRSHPSVQAE